MLQRVVELVVLGLLALKQRLREEDNQPDPLRWTDQTTCRARRLLGGTGQTGEKGWSLRAAMLLL